MTWQAALLDAVSSGDDAAVVGVVIDEVRAEQRRVLAGGSPALTIQGQLTSGDLVFDIGAPQGRSWRVSRPLSELLDRARAYPDIDVSLLSAVASSVAGKDRWDQEEWLPYGYIGAGRLPRAEVSDYVQTNRDVKIASALDDDCDVVLIGRPASGKTISVSEIARLRRMQHDDGIVWLDLIDPFDNAETVMLTLLTSARHRSYLVVVDNLQANVSATSDIFELIQKLRNELDVKIRILATCWSSAVTLVEKLPPQFTRIAADGSEVVRRILAERPEADSVAGAFDELAGGDVVLLKTALDHFRVHGTVPQPDELADAVATRLKADQLLGKEARRVLYWFACLGEFEIGVYQQYCAQEHPEWPIVDLRRRGLVRLDDEMYTIGHPSLAAALVRYAVARWNDPEDPFESPSRLAFEYLRRAGKPAVQAVLDKLDLVNHGYGVHRSERVLAKVWRQRSALCKFLRDQAVVHDCTWGGNAASAVFAAVALALLDQREAWVITAEYVRRQWDYGNSRELPKPHGARRSAEADDFLHIVHAMREEDASLMPDSHVSGQHAHDIDVDRFYRTWMLGLLLTFENTAVIRDAHRIETLTAIAERTQQPNGAFYPERVPWITARMVNGLWHGSNSRDTSRTVHLACEWLRTSSEQGGPFDGRWHSGTGTWNSDVLTTAMCMTALMHAGIPASDHCIRAGYEYLKQQMPEWRRPGREIDCAAAAEAIMLAGPDRRETHPVIVDLLERVGREETVTAVGHEESVKIPYIAEQVVWIVQGVIESELETLLRDFETPATTAEAVTAGSAGAALPQTYNSVPSGTEVNAQGGVEAGLNLLDAETSLRVVEQMARFAREIEANITKREGVLRGLRNTRARKPFEVELERWYARKRQYDQLSAFMEHGSTTMELALRVDALGHETFPAYEPLVEPGE